MLTEVLDPALGQIEYQNGKHSQGEIVLLAVASMQFVAFFAFERSNSCQSGVSVTLRQLLHTKKFLPNHDSCHLTSIGVDFLGGYSMAADFRFAGIHSQG